MSYAGLVEPSEARAALARGQDPDDRIELERLIDSLRLAFDRPGLSSKQAFLLARLAEEAAWKIRRRRDESEMARMRLTIEAQAAVIRRMSSTIAQSRETVSRSLSSARAGLWECKLQDERLTWTDGVYEMFGLPSGAHLHRNDVLGCYPPFSLRKLEEVRSAALRTGGRFRLDAEIETAKGETRWIRVSGVVERHGGVATRLYGMKQDITEERAISENVRRLAEADPLTGLANRRLFEERLPALAMVQDAWLLLVDLDGFKQINDTLGHVAGDDYLKEAASRLRLVSPGAALVARLGGDEFGVLFAPGLTRLDIESRAQAIVEALRISARRGDFQLEFGASVGVARSEGLPSDVWFARADTALYAAKAGGRSAFRNFDPTMIGGAQEFDSVHPLKRIG